MILTCCIDQRKLADGSWHWDDMCIMFYRKFKRNMLLIRPFFKEGNWTSVAVVAFPNLFLFYNSCEFSQEISGPENQLMKSKNIIWSIRLKNLEIIRYFGLSNNTAYHIYFSHVSFNLTPFFKRKISKHCLCGITGFSFLFFLNWSNVNRVNLKIGKIHTPCLN